MLIKHEKHFISKLWEKKLLKNTKQKSHEISSLWRTKKSFYWKYFPLWNEKRNAISCRVQSFCHFLVYKNIFSYQYNILSFNKCHKNMKMRCGLRFMILIDVVRRFLEFSFTPNCSLSRTKNFKNKKVTTSRKLTEQNWFSISDEKVFFRNVNM